MKKIILIYIAMMCAVTVLHAQDKFEARKWEMGFGFGSMAGIANGLPLSRNTINKNDIDSNYTYANNLIGAITIDFSLLRVTGKHRWGIKVTSWGRGRNGFYPEQTDNAILRDSLKNYVIGGTQAYMMFGPLLSYEFVRSRNGQGRFSGHFILHPGYSLNLTADRPEYDYFTPGGYLVHEIESANSASYLVATQFRSGAYISPAVQCRIRIKNSQAIIVHYGYNIQWYSTKPLFQQISGPVASAPVSSPLMNVNHYLIYASQLKIAYTF